MVLANNIWCSFRLPPLSPTSPVGPRVRGRKARDRGLRVGLQVAIPYGRAPPVRTELAQRGGCPEMVPALESDHCGGDTSLLFQIILLGDLFLLLLCSKIFQLENYIINKFQLENYIINKLPTQATLVRLPRCY